MGIGQVISDTFGMVKGRFGQLLGLWAIYFAITIALVFVLAIGIGGTGLAGLATIESNPLAVGGGMILVIGLFYLGYLLVAMAQYASLITIPVLALFLSFQRAFIGSIASSGVKG